MTPGLAYLLLAAIAVVTFILAGVWWISGHRGGSMGEPGPIGVAAFVTLAAAAIMWAARWIP